MEKKRKTALMREYFSDETMHCLIFFSPERLQLKASQPKVDNKMQEEKSALAETN